MARPDELIIETRDGVRYGVRDLKTANRLYPGCTVISYADGRPYVSNARPAKTRKTTSRTKTGSVPADEETGDGAAEA